MKLYCKKRGNLNQSTDATTFLELIYRRNYGGKMPEIKKTPTGKPYFQDKPNIHFSLSHSKTYVLCAISSAPIGADIECERKISERSKNFFCTPEELEYFKPLELWVLKESYIKLFGKTLADIKNLHFTRKNDDIITPNEFAKSRLYRFASSYIAISTIGDTFSKDIEFVHG